MRILIIQEKDLGKRFLRIRPEHIEKIKKISKNAEINLVEDEKEEINNLLPKAEILVTGHFDNIDFKKATNLKLLHVTSAGVDNLPQEVMQGSLLVTNSSGVHPIPIAEHVFTYMLMFARQIYKTYRIQITRKKWIRDYNVLQATELNDKAIGIVGLGRIGSQIAKLAKAFDMKVLGLVRDIKTKVENVDELFLQENLSELLKKSDFVVNALPLTDKTHHLFNYELFSHMKSTAYFVNIGRGPSVKEDDLTRALKENIIAGAALDVFEEEPLPQSSELWNLENVIITPHYSGWSPQYIDRVVDIFCENLQAFSNNKPMPNLVDKKRGY